MALYSPRECTGTGTGTGTGTPVYLTPPEDGALALKYVVFKTYVQFVILLFECDRGVCVTQLSWVIDFVKY